MLLSLGRGKFYHKWNGSWDYVIHHSKPFCIHPNHLSLISPHPLPSQPKNLFEPCRASLRTIVVSLYDANCCEQWSFLIIICTHTWTLMPLLLVHKTWRIYMPCLIIIIESEVWTFTHCLGLGHETMVSAVCLSIFLWICDMAGLLRGTFVSWWYLPRIWPSVTDMQHYYHARYPTDDWHLAYMFSLVYFPSKCVWKACFPILLAQGEIPASGSMLPPSRKK